MDKSAVLQKLEQQNIKAQKNLSLAEYSGFRLGGAADIAVFPNDINEVLTAINIAKETGIDYYFIGNGSNLLVADEGYRGMVIFTSELDKISIDKDIITCDCGVMVSKLCNFALENSLSGLEFAFGIPGTVGGGIYMNAGAYGGEFKDVLLSCEYLDEAGNIEKIDVKAMDLSYRHSFFCDKKLFILSAKFKLNTDKKEDIRFRMDDFLNRRKTKQPLEYPSCGSTFKRPKNGFASAMIEECGLKGYRIGGAEVSTKHSGFVINVGGATCADVLALIEHIKAVVLKEKGVLLEPEIKTLGF